MKKSEIMKRFYKWLDKEYGDAHPHRQFMKMAWLEAFKQGLEYHLTNQEKVCGCENGPYPGSIEYCVACGTDLPPAT